MRLPQEHQKSGAPDDQIFENQLENSILVTEQKSRTPIAGDSEECRWQQPFETQGPGHNSCQPCRGRCQPQRSSPHPSRRHRRWQGGWELRRRCSRATSGRRRAGTWPSLRGRPPSALHDPAGPLPPMTRRLESETAGGSCAAPRSARATPWSAVCVCVVVCVRGGEVR